MDELFVAFERVLDPDDNQTGGGAASAVGGAMAAALVGMVARVSVGKKDMPDPDEVYLALNEEAIALSHALLEGSNRDSAAFDAVMDARRMPRATDEEKELRKAAIQAANIEATRAPFANAENCARVLALAERLLGRSNINAASDLECAFFLGLAGLRGALSNIKINLDGIKDEAVRAEMARQLAVLEARRDYFNQLAASLGA